MIPKTRKEFLIDALMVGKGQPIEDCFLFAMKMYADQETKIALSAQKEYEDSFVIGFAEWATTQKWDYVMKPFFKDDGMPGTITTEKLLQQYKDTEAQKMIDSYERLDPRADNESQGK